MTVFDCDVGRMYGVQFVDALGMGPASVFLADGSAVSVTKEVRIVD